MKFYDEFNLLDHFNKVCGIIADFVSSPHFFQELDAQASNLTIPCDMQFHDIDDWWNVDMDGQNFMELYILSLKELKSHSEAAYSDHFKAGSEVLNQFPSLLSHFDAKMDTAIDKEVDIMRYTPHKVSYAYPSFSELDGFKKLKTYAS